MKWFFDEDITEPIDPLNPAYRIFPLRLKRAPNAKEIAELRRIYLKAETDIINEIARLRSQGLVDYHAVAALERVQKILRSMVSDTWEYVPKAIEKQFYVRVPEARKIIEPIEKHVAGYANAMALTSEQHAIVDTLVFNLMGDIEQAAGTVTANLREALIGSTKPGIFRKAGLTAAAEIEAGIDRRKVLAEFVEKIKREGIVAFVDKAGRNWGLHEYANMVTRTISAQASMLAVLTADPEHDLYQVSWHGTTCGICAPYERRVFSKSGKSKEYPPLAAAFGKIDPDGPDELSNTWLNFHPNCLHNIVPYTTVGKTKEQIQEDKDFSSFTKNPPDDDPRSEEQIEAYRRNQAERAKWLRDYKQWEDYRIVLGDKVPKTFQTFQKHKIADDEKYSLWQAEYRKANKALKEEEITPENSFY